MIRDFVPADAAAVVALNAACQPEVGPMDEAKLVAFAEWAPIIRVVDVDGRIVGLLVGMTEELPIRQPEFCLVS